MRAPLLLPCGCAGNVDGECAFGEHSCPWALARGPDVGCVSTLFVRESEESWDAPPRVRLFAAVPLPKA